MPHLISSLSEMSQAAVDEFSKAVRAPIPPERLASVHKAVTQSTGLVYYDLQAPAKQLFPVITPLRNRIPRVTGNGGTATNWKAVTAINTNSLRGGVPEGKRNGLVAATVVDRSSAYKTLGLEDAVTFEAERAAVGFEDVRATTAQRLMWATMIEEELCLLGGNYDVQLGTPTAPTVATDATGGTIAAGTYNVIVVALSLFGYLASSLTGGVVGQVSVTTADGDSFTYGGGSSQKSSATSTGAITGSQNVIRAYTPVVTGAVAYAWFVGTAGSEKLEAITTLNSVKLTSLAGTGQAATAITADYSTHAYVYNGILYTAWKSGSNAYIANLATGTEGTGTPLTSDSAGGIVELDTMLQSLWDNYRLSPTTIYVSAQELKNISKKVLASSGAQYQFAIQNPSEAMRRVIGGGAYITAYLNKFAMNGGALIDFALHPNMPPGTLMACTEVLPYPINNVPNVMEVRYRQDYYQIEWPLRKRQYETGVYVDSAFAHYFPPSVGIITNIGNG